MHIHCIEWSCFNERVLPDACNVVVPASIGGRSEVVVQRHVKDGKLQAKDEPLQQGTSPYPPHLRAELIQVLTEILDFTVP
jgi:hypothetical protein